MDNQIMNPNGNDLLNVDRGAAIQKGEDLNDLMKLNRIKYNFPQDLSLISTRNFKIQYADLSNYINTANEVVIRNTASLESYIGWNSYLRFTVKVTTTSGAQPATPFYLPNDIGGVSCFTRLLFESNDGSELERIDDLATYVRNKLALICNLPYIQSVSEVAGINGQQYLANAGQNTFTRCDNNTFLVCIPLWWISGIFEASRLIPSQLMAGARLRLTLASVPQAFINSNTDSEALIFQINSLQLMADSVLLSPMISRKLLETSASKGLDFYYNTAFYSTISFTSSSIAFEIYKSVSRANALLWVTQSQAGQAKTTAFNTNGALGTNGPLSTIYGSTPFNYTQAQLRLGSLKSKGPYFVRSMVKSH